MILILCYSNHQLAPETLSYIHFNSCSFCLCAELFVALTDAVSQTRQSATSKYEAEHVQWLKYQAELEAEVQKLRAKLNHDR